MTTLILPARPFYLIRHGETEANVAMRACGGGVDTILTQRGRDQAQSVAAAIHSLTPRPTRIVHSDMNRSRDTAHILNTGLNLPIHGDNALREHMFGEWEGRIWTEIVHQIRAGDKPARGESKKEFADRVKVELARVINDHPDDLLMIVAHGGTFHALLEMHGLPMVDWVRNCQLHHFEPLSTAPTAMPWRITSFEVEVGKLAQRNATICPNFPAPLPVTPHGFRPKL